MKRFLIILVACVVVGLLGFGGFQYYQDVANQIRQKDVANLNAMKSALEGQHNEVFTDEIELQEIVLTIDYEYDQCFFSPPTKVSNSSQAGLPPPIFPTIPRTPSSSTTLPANERDSSGECTLQDYSTFETRYGIYLADLYKYNAAATQINWEAARLGEPPVLILETYYPAFR
jgi:hypothetical protein